MTSAPGVLRAVSSARCGRRHRRNPYAIARIPAIADTRPTLLCFPFSDVRPPPRSCAHCGTAEVRRRSGCVLDAVDPVLHDSGGHNHGHFFANAAAEELLADG